MRRTGRTTRLLADAAKHAATGAYVFVVGSDKMHAETLRSQFIEEHGGDLVGDGKVYHQGGSVQFSPSDGLQWDLLRLPGAHVSCVTLVDHWAIERRFAALLEMLHRYDLSHQPAGEPHAD